jgi:hypothetical protein
LNHSFDIGHAHVYGVVPAILINNFQFWIARNKANGENLRDGRTWTYNSVKAYQQQFPYLTVDQIRYAIDKLVEMGVLVVGNFNEARRDQTKWYAFKDENVFLSHLGIFPAHLGNLPTPVGEIPNSLIKTDVNTDVQPACEKTKKASRITDAWKLPKSWGEWALDKYPDWTPDFIRELGEEFRDHWSAVPGKDGLKTNWLATWRNRCRDKADFLARTARRATGTDAGATWWSSDEGTLAEGRRQGLAPRAGETMRAFKSRLLAAIDGPGKPASATTPPPPILAPPPRARVKLSAETKAARVAELRNVLKAGRGARASPAADGGGAVA